MKKEGLLLSYVGLGEIAAYRIVKFGANDGGVLQAAASTDLLVGTTGRTYPEAVGERCDIVRLGVAEVEYGASVTRGQPLTADASGRAIPAAPRAGLYAQIIGIAEVSVVSGDIGSVFISPSVMQSASYK